MAAEDENHATVGTFGFSFASADEAGDVSLTPQQIAELHHESDTAFKQLQQKLAKNFMIRKNHGLVQWLRS